nr:putative bacteriocin export ABC transporter [Gracilibacillus halotolerans]
MNNISKSFGDKVVIDRFSLKIDQGDFICIAGVSGSGKSTLLNIIGLLDAPDSGVIHVFGKQKVKPNTRVSRKLLKHKIGFLFQNFALVDDKSVNYNLDIASVDKKRLNKDNKIQLLKQLQLDIPLTKKVYQLSGGEQQRLALARLIMKDCELILADEPTASLDSKNRDIVLEFLFQLNKEGKTIVIVSHDPYIKEQCKRVISL